MTTVSILASISILLYYFKIPLPFFPPFLTLDLSDIPSLIAAIVMGPLAGIVVQLVKNAVDYLLHGSYAGFPVGQTANFLSGSLMAGLIGSFYYLRGKISWRSITASVLLFTAAISALNYFLILPAIMNALGLTAEQYTASFAAFNSAVKDLPTAVLYIIVPFNLIKVSIVYAIGLPFTFRLHTILQKRRLAL
ncbi:ECF transporter S component [Bacillus mangrovi]|uniref:Riboflavin transporter n=2 Tax=Metabacillus mangrovi TaxID=1491830 RepID=A0A7X2V768_9BACI|nr:ECF transporter S component [Metabacillus mangrovi]